MAARSCDQKKRCLADRNDCPGRFCWQFWAKFEELASASGAQRRVLPGVAHACFDDVDNVNLLSLLTNAGITQSLTQVTQQQGMNMKLHFKGGCMEDTGNLGESEAPVRHLTFKTRIYHISYNIFISYHILVYLCMWYTCVHHRMAQLFGMSRLHWTRRA